MDYGCLFLLSTIICHRGSLDAGHYYVLANDLFGDLNQGLLNMQIVRLDDTQVFTLRQPVQMLKFIAGSVRNSNSGYGDTGYMYFY